MEDGSEERRVSHSACLLFCLSSAGKTHTPIKRAWPLFYVQHASLNFNISPAMFVPFSPRQVDSAGQIKKVFLQKMHTKCGDPSARFHQGHSICPELLAVTNTKGASWQQLWKRLLIMNTKAASEKGYHFKHCALFLVFSASPFIIAFSLSFHCHCFVRANMSLGFAGVLTGIGRDMRRERGPREIHSYLDQACRLWEWFWVI